MVCGSRNVGEDRIVGDIAQSRCLVRAMSDQQENAMGPGICRGFHIFYVIADHPGRVQVCLMVVSSVEKRGGQRFAAGIGARVPRDVVVGPEHFVQLAQVQPRPFSARIADVQSTMMGTIGSELIVLAV